MTASDAVVVLDGGLAEDCAGNGGFHASHVAALRERGATWLGGCCGVEPGGIAAPAEAVAA